jgi:hypothetical protein
MSVVLLASSLIYELTGFAYADVIGAAGTGMVLIFRRERIVRKSKGEKLLLLSGLRPAQGAGMR